jgi:ferredoxin
MPTVSISDTSQTVEIASESIIYDALADKGIELPHGCLSGSCGACRVHVEKGVENLIPAGVIELNTIEAIREEYLKTKGAEFLVGKNIRLSCRARATGDVTILPLARKN